MKVVGQTPCLMGDDAIQHMVVIHVHQREPFGHLHCIVLKFLRSRYSMSRYLASIGRRCLVATCSLPSCSPACALEETVRSFSTLRIASQWCKNVTEQPRSGMLPRAARDILSQKQQAQQFSATGSPIVLKSPSDAGGPPKPYSYVQACYICIYRRRQIIFVRQHSSFLFLPVQFYEEEIQGDRVRGNSLYESRICSQKV